MNTRKYSNSKVQMRMIVTHIHFPNSYAIDGIVHSCILMIQNKCKQDKGKM